MAQTSLHTHGCLVLTWR